MSSRLTRVLAWRWTPWLFNLSLALVARALLRVDLTSRGERYTYYAMSRVFPLSTCKPFHCFRFLPPLFAALVPGEIADAFIVTNFVFLVLAGVVLWHLSARLSGSNRIAWLTTAWYWMTWAPIMSLGDPLLITDPVQAFWCCTSLYLLLTDRHRLALAMLVSGAAVKESVLLVPMIYAAYIAMTAPRASWRPVRLGLMIVAPIAAWLALRSFLHTYHNYSIAYDSPYLRETYFFGVWLPGLGTWPRNVATAALYIFGTFGAGWILGALGLARAARGERALAAAALPAMLFLALYQVPDRALATFPYAVLIPAARVVSLWPGPLTALLLIVNAAFTIRMNAAPAWLPSSTVLLTVIAALVAFGLWRMPRRTGASATGPDDDARPRGRGLDDVVGLSAAALVTAAGIVAVFAWRAAHVPPEVRLPVPDTVAVVDDETAAPSLALSPDEQRVVFVGRDPSGARRLWWQNLQSTIATPIEGTDNASAPFWAPDGERLGFFADGRLKTIDLRTRGAVIVADAPAPRGGAWGAGDVIVFAPSDGDGMYRVPALGGTPVRITALDTSAGQISHRWPSFLPDHEQFFFSTWESQGQWQAVYLGSLSSASVRPVGDYIANPAFADRSVVYLRNGWLFARPFDLRRRQALGEERIARYPIGFSAEYARGAYAIGERTLVYASTTAHAQFTRATPVGQWRDRSGHVAAVQAAAPRIGAATSGTAPPGSSEPELSPDGRWVAYTSLVSDVPQVFVRENAATGPAVQVTFEGGLHPHWRGDGRELFFVTGDRDMAVSAIDAIDTGAGFHSGAPRRLFAVDFPPGGLSHATSNFAVAPDGEHVFVREMLGQRPSASLFIMRDWRSRLSSP